MAGGMMRSAVARGLAVAALVLVAAPVAAQDVAAARAAGLVGERFDGYLGAVGPLPPALRSRVAAINIKRRSLYADLAARRGVTAQDVGVATACALLARVAVGEAYLVEEGRWRRRGAGESAPRPSYCGD